MLLGFVPQLNLQLLTKFDFTPEQKDFIWRWIRREINFVAKIEDEEEAIVLPSTE